MIDDAHIEILADHGLLLAIPAFAPAIAVDGWWSTSPSATVAARATRLTVRTQTRPAKMIDRDNFQDSYDFDGRRAHHRWMRRIEQL